MFRQYPIERKNILFTKTDIALFEDLADLLYSLAVQKDDDSDDIKTERKGMMMHMLWLLNGMTFIDKKQLKKLSKKMRQPYQSNIKKNSANNG